MTPATLRAYHDFRRMGYRARAALDYARVEQTARDLNLVVRWEPEDERYEDVFGDIEDGDTQRRIDAGEYECMHGCVVNPADPNERLASCGMFVATPYSPNWRGFAAELLGEAVSTLARRYQGTI